MSNYDIEKYRKVIDEVDSEIVNLLISRFFLSKEIREIKNNLGINVLDKERELEIINKAMSKGNGQLEKDKIQEVFLKILEVSKK
jgi:chorismate mutase